jgi:hypothetical protein
LLAEKVKLCEGNAEQGGKRIQVMRNPFEINRVLGG